MKLPTGDVWMYVAVMFGGGIYLLKDVGQLSTAVEVLTCVAASWCLLTGALLWLRVRWAPEVFLALSAFFGYWSVVWLVQDGLTAKRITTIVAVVCMAYGYFALRREIRLATANTDRGVPGAADLPTRME